MPGCLGWILAAFLCGFLLALKLHRAPPSLRKRFSKTDVFARRSFREILFIAGSQPASVVHQPGGSTLKTWQEPGYFITLAFNRQGICLGVMDERILWRRRPVLIQRRLQ